MRICCYTRVELITMQIVTIRSIWHNCAADFFFAFWKISAANLWILWRHLPMELQIVQSVVKHTKFSNRRCKPCPNRCIIGDAIVPQTGQKNSPKMRSGIWRLPVALSNAASKNCNTGAQLQSLRCTPKLFWIIYFLYDFWCAQTCSFRAVFGLPVRSLTIAVSTM